MTSSVFIENFLSDATTWMRTTHWLLPAFVAIIALRVAWDIPKTPKAQQRPLWLVVVALVCCVALFQHPIWSVWNVVLVLSGVMAAVALGPLPKPHWRKWLWGSSATLVVGGFAGLMSGYALVFSTGPSMWPTSPKHLTVHMLNIDAYSKKPVALGDDIQFAVPSDAHSEWPAGRYRKRVWGLGGDTIVLSPDMVVRNDRVLADCRDRHQRVSDNTWLCGVHWPRAPLSLIVWGTVNRWNAEQNIYTLKKDEVFVMGDNTVQSSDSRTFGPIKRHWIDGRFDPPTHPAKIP